ncbi:MAG TPA: efflux transporter outer membrane subunit [Ferruginibacter sp.]|nr:efflux transporter outer membrane subunit [Ferruginibacter sp.]
MGKKKIYTAILISGFLFYTGCKVAKPVEMPAVKEMPYSFSTTDTSNSMTVVSWKAFFSDPYLTALIDTALHNNTDLLMMLQNIDILQQQLRVQKNANLPKVDAVISGSFDKYGDYTMNGVGNFDTNLSPNINSKQKIPEPITPDLFAGFRSSWEIDVWGKLKNQKKAAMAELLASEQGRRSVITSLVSAIAIDYYSLIAYDNELQIVQKNIQLQSDALEIVKVQKEAGRATALAVEQFAAQLYNTEGIQYSIKQQISETESQLNVLLGRYPQPIARDSDILHQPLPPALLTGISSQLLIHRPDVEQAELALTAAKANVKAARAAFLPSITLSPYIGINAFTPSLLFDAGSIVYGVLAGLSAPIFNQKQIQAGYTITNAQNKQAIYNYQHLLLNSFSEVATNITSIQNDQASYELKDKEVTALTNAVGTSKDLYLSGYATYLEVILAQKGMLASELELVGNKREQFIAVINLYRSLGGGWN